MMMTMCLIGVATDGALVTGVALAIGDGEPGVALATGRGTAVGVPVGAPGDVPPDGAPVAGPDEPNVVPAPQPVSELQSKHMTA